MSITAPYRSDRAFGEEKVVTTDSNKPSAARRRFLDQMKVDNPVTTRLHPMDAAIAAKEREVEEKLAAAEEARRLVDLAGDQETVTQLVREAADLKVQRDELVAETEAQLADVAKAIAAKQAQVIKAQDRVGKLRTEGRDLRKEYEALRSTARKLGIVAPSVPTIDIRQHARDENGHSVFRNSLGYDV